MFKKAERKKSKLRLGICGTSGSGKTYSSIKLAKGLGGKIAFIDTENGSAELYSHLADFDVLNLKAPYSPARFVEAIKFAENAGYSVLIIDSLSHAWVGEGGATDMADKIAKASPSKNGYFAWRDVTPEHRKLIEAIVGSSMNIIATMRSETAYEVMPNSLGKLTPVKIGLAPIQRKGMEYEFTVVLDMSIDNHIATASKDRTGLFDGQFVTINEQTGHQLNKWLNSGVDVTPPCESTDFDEICQDLQKRIDGCKTNEDLISLYQEIKSNDSSISDYFIGSFSERKKEILSSESKSNLIDN